MTDLALMRCDGAKIRGQLPLKLERPGNFEKRSLKIVVHLLMIPGMGGGDW